MATSVRAPIGRQGPTRQQVVNSKTDPRKTSTEEEVIHYPDGSVRRIIRTVEVIEDKDVKTVQRKTVSSTTNDNVTANQRSGGSNRNNSDTPVKSAIKKTENHQNKPKTALLKTNAVDIPFADDPAAHLDIELIPQSQNTPRLHKASSIRKKKSYSMTDAKEDYTQSIRSPQPRIEKITHQPSFAKMGPRVERQPRPHTYHDGYGSYSNVSSANSSFIFDESDGEVFSFEHQTYTYRESNSLEFLDQKSPNRLHDGERRYKQNANKAASLNRAASLQLRAYKTKSLSAARTTSLDRMEAPRSTRRPRSWSSGQFTLKTCPFCEIQHVQVNELLDFDEFHDYFFHTQYPTQTIMLCELKFTPSDKIIKLKITSCNRLSRNEQQDNHKHAEVFFTEFLYEKVVPNLSGGDLENLEINVYMNNAPCNQPENKCSEAILDAFEAVQNIVEDSTLNVNFCHIPSLMNHPEPTRHSDLQGLVLLMSHPNVTVKPFNGYDWMELLMIRTKNPEKWLRVANSDLRSLIEERVEKDKKSRAGLRQMVIQYQEHISQDINHVNKAMARINNI